MNFNRHRQLPTELLHKIITWVLLDSVHSVCTSTIAPAWDMNVLRTLFSVSSSFKAIAADVAIKAFELKVEEDSDNVLVLIPPVRHILSYLRDLGECLRHPSDWGSVDFTNMDRSSAPMIFGYALYLSCVSLRRNATRSPMEIFLSTHHVIHSALSQSAQLCDNISPREMSTLLRDCVMEELVLSKNSLAIVRGFKELAELSEEYSEDLCSEEVASLNLALHEAFTKIEIASTEYCILLAGRGTSEPRASELTGVIDSLRKFYLVSFRENTYHLHTRVHALMMEWSVDCPFLNNTGCCETIS